MISGCFLDESEAWDNLNKWIDSAMNDDPGPWSRVEESPLAKPGGEEGGVKVFQGGNSMLIGVVFRDDFNRSIAVLTERYHSRLKDSDRPLLVQCPKCGLVNRIDVT